MVTRRESQHGNNSFNNEVFIIKTFVSIIIQVNEQNINLMDESRTSLLVNLFSIK